MQWILKYSDTTDKEKFYDELNKYLNQWMVYPL